MVYIFLNTLKGVILNGRGGGGGSLELDSEIYEICEGFFIFNLLGVYILKLSNISVGRVLSMNSTVIGLKS